MTITNIVSGNELTLLISGRLDVETAPVFHSAVSEIPESTEKLILDVKDMTYISSAGLRELVICGQRFPGDRLVIRNVLPVIFDIFKTTGFNTAFNVTLADEDSSTYLDHSFKSLLEKKLRTAAERIAIKTGNDTYTWKDIDMCSQLVAADLEKAGVRKGTHVGISGLNSANWIITFFAIQKLGAMAMLFNPGLFPEETAKVASIGDVTHLCYGDMPEVKDEAVFADGLVNNDNCPISFTYPIGRSINFKSRYGEYDGIKFKFSQTVGSDDPCAMIFTSGSTGKPKGVILSSYNILNASAESMRNQKLNNTDKVCLILPMFHIFGLVAGVFSGFMADSLICLPKDIRTDTLLDLIESERCTIFHTVPTMMIALLNNKNFSSERCASLRCTILAGAAATQAQIKMFREKLPNEHFISSYGLSEMAPVSVTEYGDTDEHLLNTVGKPVPNIEVKIQAPATKRECRIGIQGEIIVQGYSLMTAYYKVDPADQSIDADGWLHTGDLGYFTEEGYLRLSGRLKELIIRGGENIMPGEVESAISAVSGVKMVKVFGVPSDFFGEEVGACVTMNDGAEFDEEAIRAALAGKLSKFKIPSYFVRYDDFPLLGSGKIDSVTLKKDMLKKLGKG